MKYGELIGIVLLTVLTAFPVSGISASDTVPASIREAAAMANQFPDSARARLLAIQPAYLTTGNPYYETQWNLAMGKVETARRQFLEATRYILAARHLADSLDQRALVAQSYKDMGTIYYYLKNFQEAHQAYDRLLDLAVALNDSVLMGYAFNNLGMVHSNLNHYDMALEYFSRSLNLKRQFQPDTSSIIRTLSNISSVYEKQSRYDQVIRLMDTASGLIRATNDQYLESVIYYNYANAWFRKGIPATALKYIRLSVEVLRSIRNPAQEAETLLLYGEILTGSGNVAAAKEQLLRGLRLSREVRFREFSILYLKALAESDTRLGRHRDAVEWYEQYIRLNDSLSLESQLERIARMHATYDIGLREKENETLKANISLTELAVSRQSMLIYSMTVVLLLLGTGIWLVIRQIRLKTRLVSEIHAINARLTEANATRLKLLSIISHDLKNQFSVILSTSGYLQSNFELLAGPRRKQYLSGVMESITQTNQLLDNLLQWSRSQTHSIRYQPDSLAILPLITEQVQLFSHQMESKQIRAELDVAPELLVWADPNMLRTVLRNLISNAIKFSVVSGTIRLTASKSDRWITISVEDNGIGLTAGQLETLFNLVKTHSTPGTAGESGTGLGLVLCKEFVETNGGELTVTSQSGKGSRFRFTLPANRSAGPAGT